MLKYIHHEDVAVVWSKLTTREQIPTCYLTRDDCTRTFEPYDHFNLRIAKTWFQKFPSLQALASQVHRAHLVSSITDGMEKENENPLQ
jgi:hypothetical protein